MQRLAAASDPRSFAVRASCSKLNEAVLRQTIVPTLSTASQQSIP